MNQAPNRYENIKNWQKLFRYSPVASFRGKITDEVIDLFDFLTIENDQFAVLFPFLRETSISVFCHNISYWIQQIKTVYCIKIKLCTKKL